MKIILLQDVARIGRKGSVIDVNDGYAQNQLIPKKMAQPATPDNLKKAEKVIAEAAAAHASYETKFRAAAAALKTKAVTITAEANAKDHLFKAVSADEIAVEANAQGATVEASMISIASPIKSLGQHEVQLVWKSLKETFMVEVVSK